MIPTTCAQAAQASTSVGCEFFVADLDNFNLCDSRPYAVVVSNPQEDQVVEVKVEDGTEAVIHQTSLDPGQLEVIEVTCAAGCLSPPNQVNLQGIGQGTAFRLTADFPILAYQWNPYGVGIESTDASLLIPTTSLDGTYIATAWGRTRPGSRRPPTRSTPTT